MAPPRVSHDMRINNSFVYDVYEEKDKRRLFYYEGYFCGALNNEEIHMFYFDNDGYQRQAKILNTSGDAAPFSHRDHIMFMDAEGFIGTASHQTTYNFKSALKHHFPLIPDQPSSDDSDSEQDTNDGDERGSTPNNPIPLCPPDCECRTFAASPQFSSEGLLSSPSSSQGFPSGDHLRTISESSELASRSSSPRSSLLADITRIFLSNGGAARRMKNEPEREVSAFERFHYRYSRPNYYAPDCIPGSFTSESGVGSSIAETIDLELEDTVSDRNFNSISRNGPQMPLPFLLDEEAGPSGTQRFNNYTTLGEPVSDRGYRTMRRRADSASTASPMAESLSTPPAIAEPLFLFEQEDGSFTDKMIESESVLEEPVSDRDIKKPEDKEADSTSSVSTMPVSYILEQEDGSFAAETLDVPMLKEKQDELLAGKSIEVQPDTEGPVSDLDSKNTSGEKTDSTTISDTTKRLETDLENSSIESGKDESTSLQGAQSVPLPPEEDNLSSAVKQTESEPEPEKIVSDIDPEKISEKKSTLVLESVPYLFEQEDGSFTIKRKEVVPMLEEQEDGLFADKKIEIEAEPEEPASDGGTSGNKAESTLLQQSKSVPLLLEQEDGSFAAKIIEIKPLLEEQEDGSFATKEIEVESEFEEPISDRAAKKADSKAETTSTIDSVPRHPQETESDHNTGSVVKNASTRSRKAVQFKHALKAGQSAAKEQKNGHNREKYNRSSRGTQTCRDGSASTRNQMSAFVIGPISNGYVKNITQRKSESTSTHRRNPKRYFGGDINRCQPSNRTLRNLPNLGGSILHRNSRSTQTSRSEVSRTAREIPATVVSGELMSEPSGTTTDPEINIEPRTELVPKADENRGNGGHISTSTSTCTQTSMAEFKRQIPATGVSDEPMPGTSGTRTESEIFTEVESEMIPKTDVNRETGVSTAEPKSKDNPTKEEELISTHQISSTVLSNSPVPELFGAITDSEVDAESRIDMVPSETTNESGINTQPGIEKVPKTDDKQRTDSSDELMLVSSGTTTESGINTQPGIEKVPKTDNKRKTDSSDELMLVSSGSTTESEINTQPGIEKVPETDNKRKTDSSDELMLVSSGSATESEINTQPGIEVVPKTDNKRKTEEPNSDRESKRARLTQNGMHAPHLQGEKPCQSATKHIEIRPHSEGATADYTSQRPSIKETESSSNPQISSTLVSETPMSESSGTKTESNINADPLKKVEPEIVVQNGSGGSNLAPGAEKIIDIVPNYEEALVLQLDACDFELP